MSETNTKPAGYLAGYIAGKYRPWISIEERLPELGEKVLVFVYYWGPAVAWREELKYRDGWLWESSDKKVCYEPQGYITHWMSLPGPPDEQYCDE